MEQNEIKKPETWDEIMPACTLIQHNHCIMIYLSVCSEIQLT